MAKTKWILVERVGFISQRYENFRKSKAFIESLPPEQQAVCFQTDLDKIYEGETKKQGDIVLCDRCNEDIEDVQFVMTGSLVYHQQCVISELPKGIENVVFLKRKA